MRIKGITIKGLEAIRDAIKENENITRLKCRFDIPNINEADLTSLQKELESIMEQRKKDNELVD